VIMQMQEPPSNRPSIGLKALLSSMPNVGEETDFSRQPDSGRGDVAWES
jgi:hypothetical protein